MLDYGLDQFQQRQYEEKDKRKLNYKRNWEYYHGNQRKQLPKKEEQPDDNVTINLARYIIDKGAAFLFGKEVKFQLQEGEITPAEEMLNNIWKRNRKMTTLLKLATLGGIYGHVFIGIVPDYYGANMARITVLEAEYVEVEWKGDDIEEAWKYVVSWTEQGRDGRPVDHKQEIVQDEASNRWSITYRVKRGYENWQPDPEKADIPAWPYSWPPIIDCQNIPCPGAYYGLSDVEDMDEQDALNFIASLTQRTLRYHAFPWTWGRGFDSKEMLRTPDEVTVLPNENSTLQNLEMQSDLSSSMNFYDKIKSAMMQGARVPDLNKDNLSLGAMSGFALRIIHGDLLEKTEAKRRTYGEMLIELNRRLLELAGLGENNYCELVWQDPLPLNQSEEQARDAFELQQGLVSKETVQTRRGIDSESENERIAAEKSASDMQNGNVGALLVKSFFGGEQNQGNEAVIGGTNPANNR